jgi:Zn-dependent protease
MEMMPLEWIITYGLVIFLAIGLHEYAHCKVADLSGDPTPGSFGRVTLNLTKHFEPAGTMMIVLTTLTGFGIGWGRPAPMNPRLMRNPRWDFFAAVMAGPLSNVLQAGVWALVMRLFLALSPQTLVTAQGGDSALGLFLFLGVYVNLALAFFNFIPIGPLDGRWLVGQILPDKPRLYWYRFNDRVGFIGLFVLIIASQIIDRQFGYSIIWDTIGPPIEFLFRFFTGIHA